MKIGQYTSLTEMSQKAPHNAEFAKTLSEQGSKTLGDAVDVMFNSNRKYEDVKNQIADLKDLENAMKTCVKHGDANVHEVSRTHMGGVRQFIEDLHGVIGLYACAALNPGPMGLTVSNFAREQMSGSTQGSSSSESQSLKGGAALTLLGGGLMAEESTSSSSSHIQGNTSYNKVTTDERLVPVILDLQDRLGEVESKPALWPNTYDAVPEHITMPESGLGSYKVFKSH